MTREEIDKKWQQALIDSIKDNENFTRYHFASLVAAAERDACAEICDRLARRYGECPDVEPWAQGFKEGASVSAAKIRARGKE